MSSTGGPHQRDGTSGRRGRLDSPAPAFEDVDSLQRLRSGDRRAMERLYVAYIDKMYRLATSLTGSRSEAEDVVQEVFVGLPEALRRFEGRSGLWPWLRTTTIRCVLARRRTERRVGERTRAFFATLRRREVEGSPLDRIALEQAMDEVADAYRDTLMLRYVEGSSHAEIAHALGITRRASESRLRRARGLVGKALPGG
ncbi:MAG: RNA polymerase sigma factor [Gemmatimonadota bacterium]